MQHETKLQQSMMEFHEKLEEQRTKKEQVRQKFEDKLATELKQQNAQFQVNLMQQNQLYQMELLKKLFDKTKGVRNTFGTFGNIIFHFEFILVSIIIIGIFHHSIMQYEYLFRVCFISIIIEYTVVMHCVLCNNTSLLWCWSCLMNVPGQSIPYLSTRPDDRNCLLTSWSCCNISTLVR